MTSASFLGRRDFQRWRSKELRWYILLCLPAVVLLGAAILWLQASRLPTAQYPIGRSIWPHISHNRRFERLLSSAALPDKTVIITTLTGAWGGMLEFWLERMKKGRNTERYLGHVVVLTFEREGFELCKTKEILHCHLDLQENVVEKQEYGGPEHVYGNVTKTRMMWRRLELLSDVLEMGFNVVLTDLDVIWFRDPFRHFSVNADMTVSCDKWFPDEDLVSPNGGLWFARTNPRTREFFRFWLEDHSNRWPETEAHMHEQEAFRQIRPRGNNYAAAVIGFRVKYVSTTVFGSFCQNSANVAKLTTMHPSCKTRQKSKLARLRATVAVWEVVAKGGEEGEGTSLDDLIDPFSHPHKIVILTSMLTGEGEQLTLFVQRLEKLPGRRGKGDVWAEGGLLPHLLVLTYDAGSYQECTQRLPAARCFRDTKAETVSASLGDHPPLFRIFEARRRLELVGRILERGVRVVYSELRVVWLANPLPELSRLGGDVAVASFGMGACEPNTGFWMMDGNAATLAFVADWMNHLELRLHPNTTVSDYAQESFLRARPGGLSWTESDSNLNFSYLDWRTFGSLCRPPSALRGLLILDPLCAGPPLQGRGGQLMVPDVAQSVGEAVVAGVYSGALGGEWMKWVRDPVGQAMGGGGGGKEGSAGTGAGAGGEGGGIMTSAMKLRMRDDANAQWGLRGGDGLTRAIAAAKERAMGRMGEGVMGEGGEG